MTGSTTLERSGVGERRKIRRLRSTRLSVRRGVQPATAVAGIRLTRATGGDR